jgi:hypothetical protein
MIESSGLYSVSEAMPIIETLLDRGGGATLMVDNEYRSLIHLPACDRPPTKLPWPFSLFQSHACTLSVYRAEESKTPGPPICGALIRKHHYGRRSEHDAAINDFLTGATPDYVISITIGV